MGRNHGTLEQRRAQSRRWRLKYPEKKLADSRAWRLKNPDYKTTTYAVQLREYNARYWRERPGLRGVHHSRRRTRIIGNGGTHTLQEWRDKCDLLGNVCFYCGEARPLTEDHKTPLTRGGTDDIANILPACASCNSRKNNKTAPEFLGLTR